MLSQFKLESYSTSEFTYVIVYRIGNHGEKKEFNLENTNRKEAYLISRDQKWLCNWLTASIDILRFCIFSPAPQWLEHN